MVKSDIEAHVHFKHAANEIAQLDQAIIPMAEYVVAVSSHLERTRMRRILDGDYFRARDAREMVRVLTCAAKYAKQHLGDVFPMMRPTILDNALVLEEAVLDYKQRFAELKNETLPTH